MNDFIAQFGWQGVVGTLGLLIFIGIAFVPKKKRIEMSQGNIGIGKGKSEAQSSSSNDSTPSA